MPLKTDLSTHLVIIFMKDTEVKNHRFFGRSARFFDPVFLIGGAIACVALFGYFSIKIDQPVRTYGDHMFMLIQIKKIVNGSGWRWEPHLGFPGVQDQLLFPLFDFSHRLISEALSHFTQNIFVIDNLTYVVGIALIFGFSYYAFRLVEIRPWIALVGGIAFTMSLFLVNRSYNHDYLALCYSVPLGAILSLRLARQSGSFSVGRQLLDKTALLTLLVVATSGLYYAFFTCMFLMMTALAKSVSERKVSPALFAVAFSAILFVLLLIFGYGLGVLELAQGRLPSVVREPVAQVVYALFLGAGLHVFADAGLWAASFSHYNQVMATIIGEQLLEWPGIVISSVILISPVLAFILRALPKSEALSTSPLNHIALCAMLISFGIVFAASGGLGFVFNFVVSPIIRAQARILPFLSFFSVVIILLTLQYVVELKNVLLRFGMSVIITSALIASIAPVFGSMAEKQAQYLASPSYTSLQNISAMLARKDSADLHAVLQLPYAAWPETANVKNFALYNHQLPYLLDKPGAATRWSYGLSQSQPLFQEVLNTLDVANASIDFGDRATKLGFDGILLEKLAYSPEEIALIEERFAANPRSCKLFDDAERVLFSLREAPNCMAK